MSSSTNNTATKVPIEIGKKVDGLYTRLNKIESLLKQVLHAVGDTGSFYETHDKVRYKRLLLQQARDAQKTGGLVSVAEVNALIRTTGSDGKVSDLELRSLEYIMKTHHLTSPATTVLKEFLVSRRATVHNIAESDGTIEATDVSLSF